MQIEANEDRPTFTPEELAEIQNDDDGADEGKGGDAPSGEDGGKDAQLKGDEADPAKGKPGTKTIGTGDEGEEDEEGAKDGKPPKADPNELTEDLRKAIAAHYAAGDKKLEAKELKRLERVKDIKSLWGMYREMESKFTGGGLAKIPGKNAKPEEIAEFHKAIGVPEKPEDYFKEIKLENGAVIGEADKPVVDYFAQAAHKAGIPPQAFSGLMNAYYARLEEQAASLDEEDDNFKRESLATLKEEFGATFKRHLNATKTLFVTAPGGTDDANPNSVYARIMGGRTADGKIIGNDPDIMRWLIGLAGEVNPAATVVEDSAGGVKSIEAEIAQIREIMRTDRRRYDKEYATRYQELLAAREKIQARQRA